MFSWQRQLAASYVTPKKLSQKLKLTESERRALENLPKLFSLRITPYILSLMDRENPDCPIRAQFIPQIEEMTILQGEYADPIGDSKCSPVRGIVHRHKDRCLLFPTFTCSTYCRFCFRRELTSLPEVIDLAKPLEYLRSHPEIREVILSGGDPLVLHDKTLEKLLGDIATIDHIKILRIHTRVPVTLPMRINRKLISVLKKFPRQIFIAIHINHPKEITPQCIRAVKMLQKSSAVLLSQSVLLRGINDDVHTLKNLFNRLTELGIKPYYIHQADMAQGTSHFRVNIEKGKELMKKLRKDLSGVSMPNYMLDGPEAMGKEVIL